MTTVFDPSIVARSGRNLQHAISKLRGDKHER